MIADAATVPALNASVRISENNQLSILGFGLSNDIARPFPPLVQLFIGRRRRGSMHTDRHDMKARGMHINNNHAEVREENLTMALLDALLLATHTRVWGFQTHPHFNPMAPRRVSPGRKGHKAGRDSLSGGRKPGFLDTNNEKLRLLALPLQDGRPA
eukprot:12306753-Alexandrium_andersonii.AAC.1